MIVIIDYGIGNVGSIYNMIKKIGFKCIVSCDLKDIKRAKKIILPGVGSFDTAMEKINSIKDLKSTLTNCVIENKIPLLDRTEIRKRKIYSRPCDAGQAWSPGYAGQA